MTDNVEIYIMTKHIIISILPFAVALFWTIVMILDKDKGDRRSLLITVFTYSSVVYFCHAVYFNHLYSLYAVVESLWVFASLMVYPMFYMYIRTLTTEDKMGWGWTWLALPSGIVALLSAGLYILMTPQEVEAFVRGVLYRQSGYDTDTLLVSLQTMRTIVVQIVFLFQISGTLFFGLKLIKEYTRKLHENYSDLNGKSLMPLKFILITFVFVSTMSLTANLIGKSYFIENSGLLIVPSLTFTAMLMALGFFSYKQRFSIEEMVREDEQHTLSHHIPASDSSKSPAFPKGLRDIEVPANDSLTNQIKFLLRSAEVYRQKELKIHDLSLLLNTNRTYLSQVIKEDFDTNFSDLVNGYRTKYAARLLEADTTDREMSMEEIASLSGFSSKSSFFRVFKANMGVTPGKYKAGVN